MIQPLGQTAWGRKCTADARRGEKGRLTASARPVSFESKRAVAWARHRLEGEVDRASTPFALPGSPNVNRIHTPIQMADTDSRKLFVAGLSDSVTESELRQIFEGTGAGVDDVSVPRDRQTGRARGFGFVTLSSESDAARVRDELDGLQQGGRPMSVKPFRGNRPPGPSRPPHGGPGGGSYGDRPAGADREPREATLFLANLPGDCRDEEVRELFEQAGVGPIVKLHMPVDPEGRRRGFGFVSLADPEQARAAVPKLKECALRGRPLTVDVARPRSERSGPSGPPTSGSGGWRSRPPGPRRDGDGPSGGSSAPFSRGDSGGGGGGGGPPTERQTWDERRVVSKRSKKEPKRKKVRAQDRGRSRRENEGFRAPRARGMMDDWEED